MLAILHAFSTARTHIMVWPCLLEARRIDQWVCIHFSWLSAEGGMTNGRGMMRFSRGFMRFGRGLPIVPCALRVQTAFDIKTHTLTSR